MRTDAIFQNYQTGKARRVEIGMRAVIGGNLGHVRHIGRKYVTFAIYGGKPVKIDPLCDSVNWTGDFHN